MVEIVTFGGCGWGGRWNAGRIEQIYFQDLSEYPICLIRALVANTDNHIVRISSFFLKKSSPKMVFCKYISFEPSMIINLDDNSYFLVHFFSTDVEPVGKSS